jgi:hypothetical protein
MTVSAFTQDPNIARVYGIDWTLDPGDSITASTWARFKDDGVTATTEITIGTNQYTNTPTPKTTVLLSYPAPVVGTTHWVTNHITLASGQTADHTLIVLCLNE